MDRSIGVAHDAEQVRRNPKQVPVIDRKWHDLASGQLGAHELVHLRLVMLNDGVAPACTADGEPGEPCPVRRTEQRRVVAADVLDEFTTRFDDTSSRALGWDTPSERSSGGDYITNESFGHTGYTGTSIWMDPELDLWVILLTNRVHPTRENQKHVPLRRAVADAAVLSITDRTVQLRGSR